MKIKIMDISLANYPSVLEELNKLGKEGWILNKIFMDNIFIFKETKEKNIKYKVEIMEYNKRKELDRYKEINKSKGWNYNASSREIYIYSTTELDKEITPPIAINRIISKKRKEVLYTIFQLIIWYILFKDFLKAFKDPYIIQDSLFHKLAMMIIFFLFIFLYEMYYNIKFLIKNRRVLKEKEDIKYIDNKFGKRIYKIINILLYISIVGVLIDGLYFIIKSNIVVAEIIIIYLVLFLLLYFIYKKFLKNKISLSVAALIFMGIILVSYSSVSGFLENREIKIAENIFYLKNTEESEPEFEFLNEEDKYREGRSIFVNKYFEYTSIGEHYFITEYTDAKNENIAKDLVERYKYRTVRESNEYRDKKTEKNKIEDVAIEDDNKYWNADEVYLLKRNYYDEKNILIRKGNKVYYFLGLDFSEGENREYLLEKLKF